MTCSLILRDFVARPALAMALLGGLCGAELRQAWAAEPTSTPASKPEPDRLTYTLGVRAKIGDLGDPLGSAKLRPRLGLRYGKWKLGIGDGREWLQFSGYIEEKGISYQVSETSRWQVSASGRLFNASTGGRYDLNEPDSLKGKLGIQATASVNYTLSPVLSLGVSVMHDLLGDGNGQTVGLGVSRTFAVDENRVIYASAGVTWGSAQHWQTAHNRGGYSSAQLGSGLGSVGFGLAYRHALSPSRAWYAKASTGYNLGQRRTLYGNKPSSGGELGMLWFTR
jgi:hypothetical protein